MPGFLDLPVEIRIKIYAELLPDEYQDIEFGLADPSSPTSPLIRTEPPNSKLHPSIISVNKTIAAEAVPLLYLKRNFYFPRANIDPPRVYVTPILKQIGASNAALIQHVSTPYPEFELDFHWGIGHRDIHKLHIETLSSIKEHCPSLQTLTLVVPAIQHPFNLRNYLGLIREREFRLVAYALERLSLKKIVLDLQVNRPESAGTSLTGFPADFRTFPEEDPVYALDAMDIEHELNMPGWTVKLTKVPDVWICPYSFAEFSSREARNECSTAIHEETRRRLDEIEELEQAGLASSDD